MSWQIDWSTVQFCDGDVVVGANVPEREIGTMTGSIIAQQIQGEAIGLARTAGFRVLRVELGSGCGFENASGWPVAARITCVKADVGKKGKAERETAVVEAGARETR